MSRTINHLSCAIQVSVCKGFLSNGKEKEQQDARHICIPCGYNTVLLYFVLFYFLCLNVSLKTQLDCVKNVDTSGTAIFCAGTKLSEIFYLSVCEQLKLFRVIGK